MSKQLRLTRPARTQLEAIISYTYERFGRTQAARYRSQLIAIAERLCDEEAAIGRSCSLIKGDDLLVPNLFFFRAGMHYIIYTESERFVTIHDFVHSSRDLPTIIAQLESGLID